MGLVKRLNAEGFPAEQLPDIFTRKDDLLQVQARLLQQILDKLGGSSSGGSNVNSGVKKLSVATVPLGAPNSEVRFQFPIGTKQFVMHTRNGKAIRLATDTGKAGTSQDPYFTLKANTVYTSEDLNITDFAQTFYLSCSDANEVLEIIIGA